MQLSHETKKQKHSFLLRPPFLFISLFLLLLVVVLFKRRMIIGISVLVVSVVSLAFLAVDYQPWPWSVYIFSILLR